MTFSVFIHVLGMCKVYKHLDTAGNTI